MGFKYGDNVDIRTQLILKQKDGTEALLSFGTKEAKKAYVKLLTSKGSTPKEEPIESPPDVGEALEQPLAVSCEVSEEQLQKLRRMGWLRDNTETESPEVEKPKVRDIPPALKPESKTKTAVFGGGRQVEMGSLNAGILGYLIIQICKEEEVGKELERIQGLTKEEVREELDGVLKYQGGKHLDIISAILNSYTWALTDQKLLDKLLGTEARILQYQNENDPVLGVVKDYKTFKGENLIGHVLMSLREELGGCPDPRIALVKGKRRYSVAEMSPGEEDSQELKESFALAQAQVFLGKRPSSEKRIAKWEKSCAELVSFILSKEWWPFPSVEEFVLVRGKMTGFVPRPLSEWLELCATAIGTKFIGAKEHGALGGSYVQGVEEVKIGKTKIHTESYVLSRDSHKVHLYLSEASEWWTWFLSEQTAKLTPEDLAELTGILAAVQMQAGVQGWEVNGSEFHMWSSSEEHSWNFKTRVVEARQTRKAFATTIINGEPVSSNWTLVWLALKGLQTFKGINGILAALTNLWEREANYGHRWEDSHPTRRIRDNSGAPLISKFGFCFNQAEILNGQFNYKLFLELVASPAYRHDCYVDKNGMKLMAGNGAGAAALTSIQYTQEGLAAFEALDAGCNPLMVMALILGDKDLWKGMVDVLAGTDPNLVVMRHFGMFVTGNDGAKVTKFLNRAQQGGSWNEAYAVVTWKGKEWKRSQSALQVKESSCESWVPATPQDEQALLDSLF